MASRTSYSPRRRVGSYPKRGLGSIRSRTQLPDLATSLPSYSPTRLPLPSAPLKVGPRPPRHPSDETARLRRAECTAMAACPRLEPLSVLRRPRPCAQGSSWRLFEPGAPPSPSLGRWRVRVAAAPPSMNFSGLDWPLELAALPPTSSCAGTLARVVPRPTDAITPAAADGVSCRISTADLACLVADIWNEVCDAFEFALKFRPC